MKLEGTQPEQWTKIGQQNIPYHTLSCSVQRWEWVGKLGFFQDWSFRISSSLGLLVGLGIGQQVVSVALCTSCLDILLLLLFSLLFYFCILYSTIKLFLSQPTSLLIFIVPVLSPIPKRREGWMSSCVVVGYQLGSNHDKGLMIRSKPSHYSYFSLQWELGSPQLAKLYRDADPCDTWVMPDCNQWDLWNVHKVCRYVLDLCLIL